MPAQTHPHEGYATRAGELATAMAHGKYWRRAVYGLAGLLGLAILGLILLGARPAWKPKYIEIDTCQGDTRVVGDAPLTYTRRQVTITSEVKRFVKDLRRLSTDIELTKEAWRSLEFRVTPEGRKQLLREQDTRDPLHQRGAVWVDVLRAIPRAGASNVLDVRWQETTYNEKREPIGRVTQSGLFTYQVRDPVTNEELDEEPAGVFLHEWHYGKDPS
jgi:type IV secretory pathway TrbF-like protein